MASELVISSGTGCPETLPNGEEGQSLQVVNDCPEWVDGSAGAVSVVTPNSPTAGQYTHDNGEGTTQVIDTRGISNPYDPALDPDVALTSTNMQEALDELAFKSRPWAAQGDDQDLTKNQESTTMNENVYHPARVGIGTAFNDDGTDTVDRDLDVRGVAIRWSLSGVNQLEWEKPGNPAGQQAWSIGPFKSNVADNDVIRIIAMNDDFVGNQDTVMSVDRFGNWSNNVIVATQTVNSAEHVIFLYDESTPPNTHRTVAPTAPPTAATVAIWAKDTANFGELFVMDGAGNVTQLSSHPQIAKKLIPKTKFNQTGRYEFDYNVYTREGRISDSNHAVIFDIDTGKYDIYDRDDNVIKSGTEKDLADYGKQHPKAK